ncbi:cystatin-C-like [Callospermophilus lateralis]|uniref:cystatin-C-like n=1 Tax=Callospermophilus lateralis TaxID=76772 RepID=UPI0040386D8B
MVTTLHLPLLLLSALVASCAASESSKLSSTSQETLGGLEDADIHEEEVRQAIDYSVGVYNQENNDLYYSRVRRVVRARQQVVAGMNYYLDLEMGQTTCTKTQSDLSECPFDDSQDQQRTFCSFQVYSVPWLRQISVTEYSCHNE